MTDFVRELFKMGPDGIIPFPYANASYKIYNAGTATVVASGTTDNNGYVIVATLPSGHYDIKINDTTVYTFQHIKYDDFNAPARTWQVFIGEAINADSDEVSSIPVFAPGVLGKIQSYTVTVEHVGATGDITIHPLVGDANGSAALTVASNAVEPSHRVYPQVEKYRYSSAPIIPTTDIIIENDQAVTIGWDYVAGTIAGLSVVMIFKPNV